MPISQAKTEAAMEIESDSYQEMDLGAALNDIGELKISKMENIRSIEKGVDYKVTYVR